VVGEKLLLSQGRPPCGGAGLARQVPPA
jgi:hypothetical protein